MRHRPRPHAFTLVELLVVIGIIAVLVGILLPTLNRARGAARSVQCLSNMKNLANSIANYLVESNGVMSENSSLMFFARGPNASVTNDPMLAICPELNVVPDMSRSDIVGYGWSNWVSFVRRGDPPFVGKKVMPARIRHPSEVAYLGDTAYADKTGLDVVNGIGLLDPFLLTNKVPAGDLQLGLPNFHGRHGGRGVVLWMDLHATMEPVVLGPDDKAKYDYLPQTPAWYRANKLGFLARSTEDLKSMAGEYYFVFKKEFLQQNRPDVYLAPDKGAW